MTNLIFIGSVFLVFVTIYLLFFSENASRSYSDYLLSILLLTHTWSVILFLLLFSEYILNFPHLFKTGLPVNFLIAPLSYLYVRSVLYNERKLIGKDFIHFLPFIFVFLNYLPFYILPVSEKLKIIDDSLNYWPGSYTYQAGYLPENLTVMARILLAIFYLIKQWNLIYSYKKVHQESLIQDQIQKVLKWLKLFTITTSAILFGLVLVIILIFLFPAYYRNELITLIPSLLVSVSFFLMASYLLTHQEILKGLPFVKYKSVLSSVENDKSYNLPYINADYSKEMERIIKYFEMEQPFLKKDLNINQVSVALSIPSRELSYIINNHFGQRFTDFLNRYRIEYITKKINKEYLSNYTFEAIAREAGFASKSSFNLAFKKFNNCTPTEFLNQSDLK